MGNGKRILFSLLKQLPYFRFTIMDLCVRFCYGDKDSKENFQ